MISSTACRAVRVKRGPWKDMGERSDPLILAGVTSLLATRRVYYIQLLISFIYPDGGMLIHF